PDQRGNHTDRVPAGPTFVTPQRKLTTDRETPTASSSVRRRLAQRQIWAILSRTLPNRDCDFNRSTTASQLQIRKADWGGGGNVPHADATHGCDGVQAARYVSVTRLPTCSYIERHGGPAAG